jgi:hypothetical protein
MCAVDYKSMIGELVTKTVFKNGSWKLDVLERIKQGLCWTEFIFILTDKARAKGNT